MTTQTIYLVGPDTPRGLYLDACTDLAGKGYNVVDPQKIRDLVEAHGPLEPYTPQEAARRNLRALADADAVALLPTWVSSDRALVELQVARLLGIPFKSVAAFQPVNHA